MIDVRSRSREAKKLRIQLTNDPLSVGLWAAAPAAASSALGAGLENVDAGARHGPNLVDFGAPAADDGAHRLVRHEHLEASLAITIPACGM